MTWENDFTTIADLALTIQDLRTKIYPETVTHEIAHILDEVSEHMKLLVDATFDPSDKTPGDFIRMGIIVGLMRHAAWLVEHA